MRLLPICCLLILLSINSLIAQINQDSKANLIEKSLLPAEQDLLLAEAENFEVFRILPREIVHFEKDAPFFRGGGAYYSFSTKTHDYNKIPQIGLERDFIKSGFYGASFGFIGYLRDTPLSTISIENEKVGFLANYKPPKILSEIRKEPMKYDRYESDGIIYRGFLPAVVGHTYILRAISFDEADILVALKIHRKDADGSLIIFWKKLQEFETPKLLYQTDEELTAKVEKILQNGRFDGVNFEVKDNVIILRGSIQAERVNELYKLLGAERTKGFNNSLVAK